MADSQQSKFVTTADGRRITYARWKYEQSRQQEAVLRQVNDLITNEAANAVAAGASLGQQEYGAFLRDLVVPNLLDKYGTINATAAIQFYDQSRTQWEELYSSASTGGRDARRSASSRFARARTQGAINAAQGYAAQFADTYDVIGKTDTVVNFAMKVRSKSGQAPSVAAMNNALTREVASYHRDTILFNSALDPYVQRVQRVAQASACEFCRLMALGSTNGKVRTSTYAVKFHSHCHCTIQPLFDGEQPVRPDYYDKFEKQYAEASKSGGSAKSILAKWRANEKSADVVSQEILPLNLADKNQVLQTLNYQAKAEFKKSSFDESVVESVSNYTNGTGQYNNINGLLRRPETYIQEAGLSSKEILNTKQDIQNLDLLMDKAPTLENPVVTYRGINYGDVADQISSLKPGQSFQDLAFTSTSFSIERATGFYSPRGGVLLEIQNDVGTKGIVIDAFRGNGVSEEFVQKKIVETDRLGPHKPETEMEWLLARGTKFEILEHKKDVYGRKTAVVRVVQ